MTSTKKPPRHQNRIAESLRGQARICQSIASECWDEDRASRFEAMARQCNQAAASAERDGATQAAWPAGR
jgi:hypothetical protein